MIDIIPAIDIMNGQCVRLTKGLFESKKVYSGNPAKIAMELEEHGIKRLHLVDLDGARLGMPQNLDILKEICSCTRLVVDYGGGVRTMEHVTKAFASGATYLVIGSMAIKQPAFVNLLIKEYGPGKFILAADVKDNKVSIQGWQEQSDMEVGDFIGSYMASGISRFICTDISRDGMLQGSNIELYSALKKKFPGAYIIASGGVASTADIRALNLLDIDAVIIGKALYEGKIGLSTLKKMIC